MVCEGFKNMRLNISGSAACPVKVDNWVDRVLDTYMHTYIGTKAVR